jgi:hypothetical protein
LIKTVTPPTWRRAGFALLAALAALATVSACSSGLITQTNGQVAAVPGASANTGEAGEIALRGVMIAYNGPQGYPIGANAPLIVRIFNSGLTKVNLVAVDASGVAARVEKITDGASPPAEATPDPSPSATGEPGTTPTPTPEPDPTAGILAEADPSSYALLVPGRGAYLQLVDLTQAIGPGESAPVTFRLTAGDQTYTVTLAVPVAPPETALPRETGEAHA